MLSSEEQRAFINEIKSCISNPCSDKNPWMVSTVAFCDVPQKIITELQIPYTIRQGESETERKLSALSDEELIAALIDKNNECGLHIYWDFRIQSDPDKSFALPGEIPPYDKVHEYVCLSSSVGLYLYGGGDFEIAIELDELIGTESRNELEYFALEQMFDQKEENLEEDKEL